MILRSWHGATPAAAGDAFEDYFRGNVLPELEARPGNRGAFFRRERRDGHDHFFLLTYWDGWASIRAFAGEEPHVAVAYPDDRRFGLIADPIVLHQPCTEIHPWFGEAPAGPARA